MRLFEHKPHKYRIRNINLEHDESLSLGDRIADKVAAGMGSIPFIIIQSLILASWIIWNSVPFLPHFDPMPFILLNLGLSFQAGYAAPFILISQNRQAAKDRLAADHDYQINMKGEEETRQVYMHLYEQDAELVKQTKMLVEQNEMLIKLVKHLIDKEQLS